MTPGMLQGPATGGHCQAVRDIGAITTTQPPQPPTLGDYGMLAHGRPFTEGRCRRLGLCLRAGQTQNGPLSG